MRLASTQPPAEGAPAPRKSNSVRNAIIAVAVLAVAAIAIFALIGAAAPQTNQLGQSVNSNVAVTVNAVNLQVVYSNGASNGFLGPNSQSMSTNALTLTGGQEFTETLTLNNQASIITTHSINSFAVNTAGFILDSVSPSTPYSLGPGATATFTLTFTAPTSNYNGPLNIVVYAS